MVLVDTSVWLPYLAGREPFATGLDDLLGRDEVVGHELILGELLIGDRGGCAKLLSDYAQMHQAGMVPHQEVVEFVRSRRLLGRGVGWIDIHLLASAMVERLQVWRADPRFSALAEELHLAYQPLTIS